MVQLFFLIHKILGIKTLQQIPKEVPNNEQNSVHTMNIFYTFIK